MADQTPNVEPDNNTQQLPVQFTATDDGHWRTIRLPTQGEMLHPDDRAGDDWGHAG